MDILALCFTDHCSALRSLSLNKERLGEVAGAEGTLPAGPPGRNYKVDVGSFDGL